MAINVVNWRLHWLGKCGHFKNKTVFLLTKKHKKDKTIYKPRPYALFRSSKNISGETLLEISATRDFVLLYESSLHAAYTPGRSKALYISLTFCIFSGSRSEIRKKTNGMIYLGIVK